MILLLNVFLKPEHLGPTWFDYDRGGRSRPQQHEVLLHTLRTYAAIGFTEAYLCVEFHPEYEIPPHFGRQMYEALGCRTILRTEQVKTQTGWQALVNRIAVDHPGEPVWLAGNHDHPLVDATLIEPLKRLFSYYDASLMSVVYSHWSEFINEALGHVSILHPEGFVSYGVADVHSIRVVTQALLRHWWFDHDYGHVELPRSDWWIGGGPWNGGRIIVRSPMYDSFVPLREICRHFDGYSHIGLGPDSPLPPLTIPHTPDAFSLDDKINCVPRMHGRHVPEEWKQWL